MRGLAVLTLLALGAGCGGTAAMAGSAGEQADVTAMKKDALDQHKQLSAFSQPADLSEIARLNQDRKKRYSQLQRELSSITVDKATLKASVNQSEGSNASLQLSEGGAPGVFSKEPSLKLTSEAMKPLLGVGANMLVLGKKQEQVLSEKKALPEALKTNELGNR